MCDLDSLTIRHVLGQLVQVGRTWQKKSELLGDFSELAIQLMQTIGLHGLQIKDLVATIGRACEAGVSTGTRPGSWA